MMPDPQYVHPDLDAWLADNAYGRTEAVCELGRAIADADYSECEDDTEAGQVAADVALSWVYQSLQETPADDR